MSSASSRSGCRPRWGAALLAALLAACGAGPERSVRIVLITVDTLRNDSFLAPDGAMPHARAFAARGQVFEEFYAASSSTQPTHASLLTGLQPWEHGVTRNGQVLDARHETLAERLGAAGFETAAVVASFPLHARFGFAQGFDRFEQEFGVDLGIRAWAGAALDGPNFYSLADAVTGRAVAALDRARAPRQFFWFHYFDPHSPYGDGAARPVLFPALLGLAREDRERLPAALARARSLYDRDVRRLDRSLARLFERLDRDARHTATHVLLASDHGESFGEDGSLGHGQRLTREQVQVPLFVVSPELEPGRRRDPAGSIDVAATVCALAGLAGPCGGRDLLRPIAPEKAGAAGMRPTVAEPQLDYRTDGRAVVIEDLRFFAVRGGRLFAGNRSEVVEDDIAERVPDTALARSLRARFARFEGRLAEAPARELTDAATREALEALGYAR